MGSTDNDLRLMRKFDFEVAPIEEINTKPFFKGQPPEMKSKVVLQPHKPKRKDYSFRHDGDLVNATDVKTDVSKPNSSNPNGDLRNITDLKLNSEYIQELDETVKSMMEKIERKILVGKQLHKVNICKVCGKEGQWVGIRDHIEANHLQGVSLPCDLCEKTFRSRKTLRVHKSLNHKA